MIKDGEYFGIDDGGDGIQQGDNSAFLSFCDGVITKSDNIAFLQLVEQFVPQSPPSQNQGGNSNV